jgi:hypothetical protein
MIEAMLSFGIQKTPDVPEVSFAVLCAIYESVQEAGRVSQF